jgi:hypothetical protein
LQEKEYFKKCGSIFFFSLDVPSIEDSTITIGLLFNHDFITAQKGCAGNIIDINS